MAIMMQGSWTVSVKSKNASDAQRFIITGAASGNGTYAGETATPSVFVTGEQWSIRIENKPNARSPWKSSAERVKFPVASGGLYRFDIESNDLGPDQDFNDLILTCSMPQTTSDFLIYGNVKCYSGFCILNPCWPRYIVIETLDHFREALKAPALRAAIKELYPDRIELAIDPDLVGPFPIPDPPPFRPIVLPLQGDSALPPRLAQVLTVTELPQAAKPAGQKQKAVEEEVRLHSVEYAASFEIDRPARRVLAYDRETLGSYVDHLRCHTEPLPGFVLRFLEYDRTAAELAGGPYSGDGAREQLGLTVTDVNGNYVFRFSRDFGDVLSEVAVDTAVGENQVVQARPDVIVQLLDATATGGVAHETAPSWNVPVFRRIDLCFPCSTVTRPSSICGGSRPLERIGRIKIGIPETTFDSEGRVTSTDLSQPGIPQARCSAWFRDLSFFACIGDYLTVTQYTLRHRHRVGAGWSDWEYYEEPLGIFNVVLGENLNIGPFDRSLEIVDGGGLVAAKAYNNVHQDNQWATSEWALKAVVSSSGGVPPYAPSPGPVQFQIQGYDSAGQQVANTRDTITLYIDNTAPSFHISSVDMGTQTGGDCALFHLSGEPVPSPLRIRFKAVDAQGFLDHYTLSVRKGNTSPDLAVATTNGPLGEASVVLSRSYNHVSANPCGQMIGTQWPEEPLAEASGLVTGWVVPAAGNWLEPGQKFCTFAIKLACSKRVTNGYVGLDPYGPKLYLLGIEE